MSVASLNYALKLTLSRPSQLRNKLASLIYEGHVAARLIHWGAANHSNVLREIADNNHLAIMEMLTVIDRPIEFKGVKRVAVWRIPAKRIVGRHRYWANAK
jgi:hypothetical protein